MTPFEKRITAQPADIDELGHVNNAAWVRWIQDMATAHWSAVADPALVAAIGRLLDRGAEDPKVALAALFTRAGIAFVPAADGTPVLQ